MSRPVLLDLFCGRTGGGARGYRDAGWYVVGVDVVACPDYAGDEFHRGNALVLGRELLASGRFTAAHASPPCPGEGYLSKGNAPELILRHPRLIGPTRAMFEDFDLPYVIENVGGSSVRPDLELCGDMFDLGVIMHRYFELGGWTMAGPPHLTSRSRHRGYVRGWRHRVWRDGPYVAAYGRGGGKASVAEMQAAKRIDWSEDHLGLRDALPPAYTECIGRALIDYCTGVDRYSTPL